MTRYILSFLLLMGLTACGDGQPFFDDNADAAGGDLADDATGGDNADGTPGASDVLNTGTVRPPQAPDLVARGDIVRAEAPGEGGNGGQVSDVQYVASNDTFIVDGVGFDGANTYSRGSPIGQLGAYQVYEADVVATDSLTGRQINQIVPYRAIYGVSTNSISTGEPRTSFAIVRTGGYVDYGFGGYLYERNGNVVVPTTGQAGFTGSYAGIRVFDSRGGLEFTRGDMSLAIDFRDFNNNNAVIGRVTNRQVFNDDGSPVATGGTGQLVTPDLPFVVTSSGTDIQANGEFSGEVRNAVLNDAGKLETYEEGHYYAILSGDATTGDGGEVVGILVFESEDPRYEGVKAQETGGFIVYR